jgi:long-chain fatty acid transport protein
VHGIAAFTLAAFLAPLTAHAGGFYVTDRGVRPAARAGAFVAGADDQHAIWYNPAGLAFAPNGFLVDATYIAYDQSYTRETGGQMLDPVHAGTAPLAIPTVVINHNFGQRDWMFAFGLFAPNAVITHYDERPLAPQRYSMISLDGSVLAVAGLWAAYKPRSDLSIGLGIQALVGSFASRMTLSGCPATITCQPEDPEWDATAQLQVGPIFAPSANIGVRYQPIRYIVLGVSAQLPFWVDAPATLGVRLPSASFYDGSSVSGNRANVQFTLAPIVRAGVEVRPDANDRIEVAFVWEGWSLHDRIALNPVRDDSQPHGIQITNTRGVGVYDVGAVAIARNFQDTYSIRLGAERDQAIGRNMHLFPRLGVAYETSATAPEYTSVLTFDTSKFTLGVGLGFSWNRLRFDATFNHVFASSVAVAEADARVYQVAPFRANDQAPMHAINAGRYDLAINTFGLGVRYSF